ncbi:MAG TPA: hypothetical protein VF868_04675 [Bacteroidia bacterium]|jgi:hypothetical protein
MLRIIILFLAVCFISKTHYAQVKNDTVKKSEFPDSAFIYQKLEEFSSKRKITQLLYGLLFRPVNPKPQLSSVNKVQVLEKPVVFSDFEGKVIRKINIVTYDPFGYNPRDTSVSPQGIVKAGNAVHIKTWPVKIRNIMIIKEHDTFDSLRIKESERLIRSQQFVREVFIHPSITKGDSVDLFVRVYDVWSIIITGALTPTLGSIDGKDRNFLGAGHQFVGYYKQNFKTGLNTYMGNYVIPNIHNTYINSSLQYYAGESRNYHQGLTLSRSFYSVLTTWAGGLSLQRSLTREILMAFDSSSFEQRYRYNSQDAWLGRSWQIFKGVTEERRATSLIASGRYYRINYLERASEAYDSLRLHANENFYLASIGLSKRHYKLDNYIFKYGFIEDIPTGRAYSIVGGYQVKDSVPRFYAAARAYMANFYKWGYFNMYVEYGTFFRNRKSEEGCFLTGINYFSNIIRIGRWKLRQFIKPQYTIGFDRKSYETLSLNDDYGIRGFNSNGLKGTEKLTLTFQLQSYAPWNILGFRFGPFAVCSFGMLGTEKSGFTRSPLYSSFGIGLLLKNDYLITSHFQFSIAFYPTIPGVKNNVIKINPVKTTDYGVRGFDISQPSVVSYQ